MCEELKCAQWVEVHIGRLNLREKNILNIRVKYVFCVTLQYSLEILVSSVIIYRVEGKIRANMLLNFHVKCRLFWFKFSQNCTVRTIGIINQCLLPLKNESNISAFSNCYMRTDRQTDRPRDRYIMKNTVTIFPTFHYESVKRIYSYRCNESLRRRVRKYVYRPCLRKGNFKTRIDVKRSPHHANINITSVKL